MPAIKFNLPINILKKITLSCLFLLLTALLIFCWWYVTTGRDTLILWFNHLNSCFYRGEFWTGNFFTEKVKAAGNLYCFAALAIILLAMFFLVRAFIRSIKAPRQTLKMEITGTGLLQVAICIIVPVLFWFWGTSLVPASNDEAFSGVYCAGIHPFQTLSYYMLPNNHVFYNLLNNLLFHAVDDKVLSGRILSLLSYCALCLLFFSLFKTLLKNSWLALIIASGMAIQFPVWAFGCQARGYELLTLCEWTTFIACIKYTFYHERKWLYLMAAASVAGYFTIPIFLYMDAAILLFALCFQLAARKIDIQFWLFQVAAALIVFLLYVPCFCFSGVDAIISNPWMTIQQPYSELWHGLVETCHEFMDYTFCNNSEGYYYISLILFLFPFSMIFYRHNKTARFFGWFYLCMWGILILFTLKMHVYPMDRALQGQFSITYAFSIYSIYLALSLLAKKINFSRLPPAAITVFLLLLGINYAQKGKIQIIHYPCHFNCVIWNNIITTGMNTYIPRKSSVACSYECFYFYYLCRNNGYDVSKCPRGDEQYMVKLHYESYFQNFPEQDFVIIGRAGDMGIYKRKTIAPGP